MKKLAPCLLVVALMCLSSCSRVARNLGPNVDPGITAYLQLVNKEARQENAPFRYRVSANGKAFEKYPAANFDEILHEIDIAVPRQTATNAEMQWDIMACIAVSEKDHGGDINPVIVETRPLKRMNGFYREAWIVDRNGDIVEYLVTVKPVGADIQYKVYAL